MEIFFVAISAAFFLLMFVMIQGVIRALLQVLWRRRRLNNF
jgi:hypothetical protein